MQAHAYTPTRPQICAHTHLHTNDNRKHPTLVYKRFVINTTGGHSEKGMWLDATKLAGDVLSHLETQLMTLVWTALCYGRLFCAKIGEWTIAAAEDFIYGSGGVNAGEKEAGKEAATHRTAFIGVEDWQA